jgi:hypothetical protein
LPSRAATPFGAEVHAAQPDRDVAGEWTFGIAGTGFEARFRGAVHQDR